MCGGRGGVLNEANSCEPNSCLPPADVEKVYRQTDVCFEENNDGDLDGEGLQIISEDCRETSQACTQNSDCQASEICDRGWCQVDDDQDGLFSEDCTECGGESSPGTLLPITLTEMGAAYQLNPVLKRNERVASYNPGQYYAVSTVTTNELIDLLWIIEDYDMCTDPDGMDPISRLNPRRFRGGGNVLLVLEENGEFIEVLNSRADEIDINTDPDNASVHLEDVPEGSILHVYVKFGPGLKNQELPEFPDNLCMNFNTAQTTDQVDPLCPGASNCCETGHGMGCDDNDCESLICLNDSDCCTTVWDSACVASAEGNCFVNGYCPAVSNCCDNAHGSGCNDPTCEQIICDFDPFCCDTDWDNQCIFEANEFCAGAASETAKANLIVGDDTGEFAATCDDPNSCGNFTQCNASECGGNGACFIADPSLNLDAGTGICGDVSIFCVDLFDCSANGQSDCNGDEVCIANTCCGPPVCLPLTATCPNTGITSLSVESSSSSGPTIGNAGN